MTSNQADIILRVRSDTRGAREAADAVARVARSVREAAQAVSAPVRLTAQFDDRELARARAELAAFARGAPPVTIAPKVDTRAVARAEADIARLAKAQATAQAATGDYAQAQTTLISALARVSSGSIEAARLETQLANVRRQGAQAQERASQVAARAAQQQATAGRQAAQAQERQAAAAQRQVSAAQRTADSEIRAARATGEHARALDLIERELQQAGQGTIRYNSLLAQQASAQRAAARSASRAAAIQQRATRAQASANQGGGVALPRTFAGVTRGGAGAIGAGLGALGLAAGAAEVARFTVEAGRAANTLEKTQTLVKSLSGDSETYSRILALASDNQRRFGGSLAENLGPLGRLAPLARNTGTEIAELDKALRLLALASPEQGLEGANIALRDFLQQSGAEAVLSLADRFELDRRALQGLAQEGVSTQDRLTGLFNLLKEQGFSAATLEAQSNTTAASYDRLGGAASNLTDALGRLVAEGFRPAAEAGAGALQALADGINFVNSTEVRTDPVAEAAQTYEEYVKRVNAANRELAGTNQILPVLSEEQFRYARAVQNSGASAEEAARQAQGAGVLLRDIASAQQLLTEQTGRSGSSFTDLGNTLQRFAAQGTAQQATVQALVIAFLSGELSAASFERAVGNLEKSIGVGSNAFGAYEAAAASAAGRVRAYAAGINEAARASATAKLDSVVGNLNAVEGAAFGANTEAARLIGILRDLQSFSGVAFGNQEIGTVRIGTSPQDRFRGFGQRAAETTRDQESGTGQRQRERERAAEEARRDQIRATGTQAQQVALAEKELADARKRFGADSAEAIRAETALRQARDAGRRGGGGGISADVRADLNATNDLIAQRDILAKRLSQLKQGTNEYKNTLGQLLDIEEKIASQKERQVRSALDLRIGQIEERRTRREEDQRVRQAERIVRSGSASEEQRAAARDVLELIPLERERRELDLARTAREAQGAEITFQDGAVQVLIDGKVVEGRVITNFRGAVQQQRAQGGV